MKQPKLTPDQWQQFNMLQTIIKTYSPNPNVLRSSDGRGGCYYFPPADKPLSLGCAIGCFIPWKAATKFKKSGYNSGSIDEIFTYQPDLLPKWMIEMDVDFLEDCQSLHDIDGYWDNKGLTPAGEAKVELICNHHNLPYELIEW